MTDRLANLLEEAQGEPHLGRPNWAQYGAIVRTLREKTWSYRRIFDWLVERGEPLDPAFFHRFRIAMSTLSMRKKASAAKAAAKRTKGGQGE